MYQHLWTVKEELEKDHDILNELKKGVEKYCSHVINMSQHAKDVENGLQRTIENLERQREDKKTQLRMEYERNLKMVDELYEGHTQNLMNTKKDARKQVEKVAVAKQNTEKLEKEVCNALIDHVDKFQHHIMNNVGASGDSL